MERFGVPFTVVHKWIDDSEAIKKYGIQEHRRVHHNPYKTPQQATQLFGLNSDLAVYDHILLDILTSKTFPNTKNTKEIYIKICQKALAKYPYSPRMLLIAILWIIYSLSPNNLLRERIRLIISEGKK